jgi:hypothetical protein
MYEAMKQIGAEVLYTEYPGGTHASWERAYDEPKLFPWLFSKSLGGPSRTGFRQTDHQAERHSMLWARVPECSDHELGIR